MYLANLALAAFASDNPPWTQARLEEATAEIQVQVEAIRGVKFQRPVNVKVADTAILREYMAKREAEMTSPGRPHRDECVAKLLGLAAPELDLRALELEVLEGQVGGFYDPGSDTFFLMSAMKGEGVRVILAHELTHALDDQIHDLDARLAAAKEETDAELAIRCVVEGSGTNLMNRWTLEHGRSIPKEDMAALQEMGVDVMKKAPPLLWKPLVASYFAGDAFLARKSGFNLTAAAVTAADVDRAFREPPRSMEQVLHPDRYWDPKKLDEPLRVEFDSKTIPAGWSEMAQDTLGEFALALFTTPPADRKGLDLSNPLLLLGMKWSNEAASGWGGDRLILLSRGDDRFLQLVTAWDSVKDAEQFAAALEKAAPKLFAGTRETTAGFVSKFTPTHFDVRTPTDMQSPTFVVVRAASIASAEDNGFSGLDVRWSSRAAEKAPEPHSPEDDR